MTRQLWLTGSHRNILELAVDDPEAMLSKIRHAGAIFLGRYTPEAVGDYVAGPDHVLPTARAARYASGLSVMDFSETQHQSLAAIRAALSEIGPAAARLADAEGLPSHAASSAKEAEGVGAWQE